jgi:4-hydroxy-3-polyprenylbenzoate decarboxylase
MVSQHKKRSVKLIVGLTGATGSILGVRLLEVLQQTDVESHLVVSKWAHRTLEYETEYKLDYLQNLADVTYSPGDMGAAVSSGSFRTEGMVIIPCSLRSVAAIANGQGDHLVHRAADVILKEHRPLVLVARETPLNVIHLENLLKLARIGVRIVPPMMAFYNHPKNLGDMIDHIVMRVLDQFDVSVALSDISATRWAGDMHGTVLNLQKYPE